MPRDSRQRYRETPPPTEPRLPSNDLLGSDDIGPTRSTIHYLLVWRGRGLYVPVILLGTFAIGIVSSLRIVERYPGLEDLLMWGFVFGLAGGGGLCYWLGRRWNRALIAKPKHSFYFVPVEYWGLPGMFLGALILLALVLKWCGVLPLKH